MLKKPKRVTLSASISENPVPLCENSRFEFLKLVVGSDELKKISITESIFLFFAPKTDEGIWYSISKFD